MEPLDVLVVVISFNSLHVIERCLDSVAPALTGLTHRVVVVDNGSSDGSPELLAQRSDVAVVNASNNGYAAGLNRGVSEGAAASAILVLNPDTILHPGAGVRMFEALTASVGIVAPRMVDPTGELFRSLRRAPTLGRAAGLTWTGFATLSEQVTQPEAYATPGAVDWATGAALMMTRVCFEQLGGWDESFFLYSEETDFCLRAQDQGIVTWFEPRALVTHIGGASGRSARTHSMQVLNRVRLYRRRHGLPASAIYFALTLTVEVSRIPRGGGQASIRAVRDLMVPHLRPIELHSRGWVPR